MSSTTCNTEIPDRTPPHDLQAERGVIGSVLLDQRRLDDVRELVRPEDFHAEANRKIFGHFLAMRNGGAGAIDTTLLFARLKQAGELEAIGGAAYLEEVLRSVPVAAHARHYAGIVRDKGEVRRVIHTALEIVRDGYNGVPPAVLRKRLETALAQIGAASGIDYQPMTLAELMARDAAVEYLIDNLLIARQPILLAGPVKSLKTSILLDLCLALATGGCFLGYFRVLRSISVAILTGESGLPTVKETLARIAQAANIDPAGVERLIISDRIPHLASLEHLDALRRLILKYELELLAIDPAYLALDGADAGNVMIFGQQLRAASELCQELGVALLLCHHTRKGSGIDFQPLQLPDAAWSGFAEHCRQWLLPNHRERFELDSGTHRLWLSAGGSAGHGGLWAVDVHQGHLSDAFGRVWEVTVQSADQARDQVEDRRETEKQVKTDAAAERDCERIVKALERFPTGETAKGLREATGFNSGRFGAALARLLERHEVDRCEIQKPCRKTPFDAYKLAE